MLELACEISKPWITAAGRKGREEARVRMQKWSSLASKGDRSRARTCERASRRKGEGVRLEARCYDVTEGGGCALQITPGRVEMIESDIALPVTLQALSIM